MKFRPPWTLCLWFSQHLFFSPAFLHIMTYIFCTFLFTTASHHGTMEPRFVVVILGSLLEIELLEQSPLHGSIIPCHTTTTHRQDIVRISIFIGATQNHCKVLIKLNLTYLLVLAKSTTHSKQARIYSKRQEESICNSIK